MWVRVPQAPLRPTLTKGGKLRKDEEVQEETDVEAQDAQFVDPAIAAPIIYVIAKAVVTGIVSFFTMEFMKRWWCSWTGKNKEEPEVEPEVEE